MDFKRLFQSVRHLSRICEVGRCIRQSPGWFSEIGGYIKLWALRYPYQFRTRSGLLLELENWDDLTTAWVIYFGNEYQTPKDAQVIVDLGANMGAFSILAASHAPQARIWAVEPSPSTYHRLVKSLQVNMLAGRVIALPYAVGGCDGTVMFSESSDIPSHSRHVVSSTDAIPKIEVRALRLDSLVAEIGVEQIDLLKIDIEGSEYELISAANEQTLQKCRRIAIEYHGNGDTKALFEKLTRSGLKCVKNKPRGFAGTAAFERE